MANSEPTGASHSVPEVARPPPIEPHSGTREYWNGLKTLSEIAGVIGLIYAFFKFISSGSLFDAIFAAAPLTGYVAFGGLVIFAVVYVARRPSWERLKHVLFPFLVVWWAPLFPNGMPALGLLVLVSGLMLFAITLPETLAALGRRRLSGGPGRR